jgi:AAA ATPase domain/Helicase HerA, central domain
MKSAVAPIERPADVAPRMAAFLAPASPEVFHSIATPNTIWKADPYDVETIHAEARAAFEHLLYRAGRTPPPPAGAVLVLLGEAGSGKTHLMRAFRTRAHEQGSGYCGYLQMTCEAGNYARYMLNNLIDGLEQPYAPDGPTRTGLARLSGALLESVPGLSGVDIDAFRTGESEVDPALLVDDSADRLQTAPRFRGCDLELLRVMLHLQRNDNRVHKRALMWLRCQEMGPRDLDWIGGAVPRSDGAEPMRMLQQLARLTHAVHEVPLVLLIDQLEDMANQSAPVDRFLKVIDAITAFTDTIPNTVVVLACLEDYFKTNLDKLNRAKQDRVVRDPEPIRLLGNRTLDEIREMTARRLAHLYDTAEVNADPADLIYPFRDDHLFGLNNLRTRDALDFLRRHHQHCITVGRWEEPQGSPILAPVAAEHDLDALWNDFRAAFTATVPDEEEALARVLAESIRRGTSELPEGFYLECAPPDGRYLEVEIHKPDNGVDKRLAAVCNAHTRGTAFGKQIAELEERAGENAIAVVRTTDFPKAGKVIKHIAGMLKRDGEKVVVADAEWRCMLAFEAFRAAYEQRPDFGAWQKAARPLSELASLQKILRLSKLVAVSRPKVGSEPPVVRAPRVELPRSFTTPSAPPSPASTGPLVLGRTLSMTPVPVTMEPNEFTQHAAFLGGSGSGKTTAALNLIEHLLARDVPAVLLDRKGDLCRYADRAAWDRPLGEPARAAARQALREKLDVALFTPGEPNGRPLALPIVPPGFDQLPEAERERFAQYAAGALGSMIGFKTSDADKGQRAILAKAIETLAEASEAPMNLRTLRDMIGQQDDALLNAIGGGYPPKYYEKLAERLHTLELNNKQLLTGSERLDMDALLGTGPHAQPGRVRLSVISTRFLGDAAKVDFWVSQLLVAISRWCAKSPQPRLQAVFLFDEADLYLPATRQPATKAPMEDLLKRARSAGVGIFLATQSPGDLDYKCKENVRTWLIGRVKEPRAIEKLKPMLSAAKGNAVDKLGGQATGEFYLVRESIVTPVRSDESFMRTEQMPENTIAELARRAKGGVLIAIMTLVLITQAT